tara:strand:+ start:157 stop:738 length:582 start_codon:yes stop_codon:yes gene_type:complete
MKIKDYVKDLRISVNDYMQTNYKYRLSESYGKNIHVDMKDAISPAKMLIMGVFSGKYLNDCRNELPEEWFEDSKMSRTSKDTPGSKSYDKTHNYFGIRSRLSLYEWKIKDWIIQPDVRGWFQWWCRYYIGRRIPDVDEKQIKRWKSYKRHVAQVLKNSMKQNRIGDPTFRSRQRQSLLQWAHNPFPEKTNLLR